MPAILVAEEFIHRIARHVVNFRMYKVFYEIGLWVNSLEKSIKNVHPLNLLVSMYGWSKLAAGLIYLCRGFNDLVVKLPLHH